MGRVAALFMDGHLLFLQHGDTLYSASPDEVILMQYTGQRDKQRREIYEGDILLLEDTATAIIEYQGVGYILVHGGSRIEASSIAPESIEVIGNMYENPELIEKVEKQNGTTSTNLL